MSATSRTESGTGSGDGVGPNGVDGRTWDAFVAAEGFMPEHEARALYAAAVDGARVGPLVEIGTYLGKSAILLADAARRHGRKLVTIDHHRGSEEHQPGWEYHDPRLVDASVGLMDTLPGARRALARAGVERDVIMIVGRSPEVAALWSTPLGLVFIDGGHTDEAAQADYAGWAPLVAPGGLLAIHDVFADPADGGQAPYRVYMHALESGWFVEDARLSGTGSLRVLRRLGGDSALSA